MPLITDKEHHSKLQDINSILNEGYTELTKKIITIDDIEFSFNYFKGLDVTSGLLVAFEKGSSIGVAKCKYRHIDIPEVSGSTIQIQDIYTKEAMRGIGIAPTIYSQLNSEHNILSDTLQTVRGAMLWRVKISSTSDLFIIDNISSNPEIRKDNNGDIVKYQYSDSINTIDKTIWSFEYYDHRINPCEDIAEILEVVYTNETPEHNTSDTSLLLPKAD